MTDRELFLAKRLVQTLGKLGVVSRTHFLVFGIGGLFPDGMPHWQDDGGR